MPVLDDIEALVVRVFGVGALRHDLVDEGSALHSDVRSPHVSVQVLVQFSSFLLRRLLPGLLGFDLSLPFSLDFPFLDFGDGPEERLQTVAFDELVSLDEKLVLAVVRIGLLHLLLASGAHLLLQEFGLLVEHDVQPMILDLGRDLDLDFGLNRGSSRNGFIADGFEVVLFDALDLSIFRALHADPIQNL
eukprot:CAMPEP_0170511084 /NCGR_PEP_ID=MMETSP0208-20121228/66111_1 /TAXON_ID=197538 /ORGANISM="Strombidium inclinatum, Strain S3" /LENGTH=189 /DNA_ID=CAMNT_0010794589 /DNA_START=744 /DNA_END=1309 /DNA_ORIENTATION=+